MVARACTNWTATKSGLASRKQGMEQGLTGSGLKGVGRERPDGARVPAETLVGARSLFLFSLLRSLSLSSLFLSFCFFPDPPLNRTPPSLSLAPFKAASHRPSHLTSAPALLSAPLDFAWLWSTLLRLVVRRPRQREREGESGKRKRHWA
ncbi:hypothetical protein NL676_012952 [Syzygium grande]|nr:hypothetical protein NL676_012952 [Syzygium grande]